MEVKKTKKTEPIVAKVETVEIVSPAKTTKKKNNVGLIVGLVAALLLVFMSGATALAYNLWYQNEDKVISDAIVNMMKSKTTSYEGEVNLNSVSYSTGRFSKSSKSKINIKISGENGNSSSQTKIDVSFKDENTSFKLGGEGIFAENGDLYVKINGLKDAFKKAKIYDDMKDYHDIIKRVDANWIKISKNDLSEFGDRYSEAQACTNKIYKLISEDKKIKQELADVYKNNRFIAVDKQLGSRDGNLGYRIKIDKRELKNAVKDLKYTQLYEEIQKCDEDFDLDEFDIDMDEDSDAEIVTEVWISRFGHEFVNLNGEFKGESSTFDYSISPKFNGKVNIETPKNVISLSELSDEIKDISEQNVKRSYNSIKDNNSDVDDEADEESEL